MASTHGFSESSVASIQVGKAQFEALFEEQASNTAGPPCRAPDRL
jgi:hypothetical protein